MGYRIYVNEEGFVRIHPFDGAKEFVVDSLPDDFWKAVYYEILKYDEVNGFYYAVDTSKAVIVSDKIKYTFRVPLDPITKKPLTDVLDEYEDYVIIGEGKQLFNKVYDLIQINEYEVLVRVLDFMLYSDLDNDAYKEKILPQKTFLKPPIDKYLTPKELTLKVQLLDEAVRLGYRHTFYDWLHTVDNIDSELSQNYEHKPDSLGGVLIPADANSPVVIITRNLVEHLQDFSPAEVIFAAVGNLVEVVSSFSIQYSIDGGNTWNDAQYAGRFITKPIVFSSVPSSFVVKLEFQADPFKSEMPFIEAWGVTWKNVGE